MSFYHIKNTLETYINQNITDVAIAWNNTNAITVNNVSLTDEQKSSLSYYIEPIVVPSSDDREIIGGENGVKYEAYVLIKVVSKINTGTGWVYAMMNRLDGLLREVTIDGCVYEKSVAGGGYAEDEWYIIPYKVLFSYWG